MIIYPNKSQLVIVLKISRLAMNMALSSLVLLVIFD